MFGRVLIANRGEIAVRILRACRELGLQTVAVYSDVDRGALHVRYADDAYYIGRGPAQDSYLRIDRMIEVAQRSGAGAIHPGYGFLAENAAFAAACEDAGITFIGPSAKVIAEMGDKVVARRLMQDAGVPVLPGTETYLRDEQMLHRARQIGLPLFIKAAAGGGGKGMRLVESEDALESSLGAARREARGAFGDDRLYLEKAIPQARHIEVQILADGYGNVIHLGERECSIQRRHQKLIEEAPSPALDAHLRERIGRIAVRAAAAVDYVNAGTVEFLLAKDGSIFFLEMNTRLQVEHPVTESVVRIDIVKEQVRIASGETLRYAQQDVQVTGWAIECRITAEDPFNDFLPITGRIISVSEPSGPGIRVDSGNYAGLDVSPYYDPLLGKLIVWGNTREEAIQRMRRALREYRIIGIPTSIPFHRRVMETPKFLQGAYDTSFLDGGLSPRAPDQEGLEEIAAIAAVLLHHERAGRPPEQSLAAPSPEQRNDRASMWKLVARREAIGR
ncbi:MAG: acetyl-CoA carboxylase biotin carboxylase subunit [Anaerolineae bacterium]|jgi:acetyl-CoA carboxylase biotin carboxylase subunit